eukprot:Transcript_5573.p2 GENE.Transcript_5573~~Transcript_5573.p2  ORF type:complete len:447 (-),score=79.49 Transcript_5573:52-1392(-)
MPSASSMGRLARRAQSAGETSRAHSTKPARRICSGSVLRRAAAPAPDDDARTQGKAARSRPPRRNTDPEQILRAGFVECARLVSPALCARLANLPMEEAEGISNAFQLEVPPALATEVEAALLASKAVGAAVLATFGTPRFRVSTLKVLMTELGAEPQIPHADDHCNRELFGVAHLRPSQEATQSAPYAADACYPTGVCVQCEACEGWFPLPDAAARRRDHLARAFTCARAGRQCGPSECEWDESGHLIGDQFERDVIEAFAPLLEAPHRLLSQMAPCGAPPGVGDGLVALPTLVHRGPGCEEPQSGEERQVLFFSIAPVFSGERAADSDVGSYDSDAQIHAGWLLWRAEAQLAPRRAAVLAAYSELGFSLGTHLGEGDKLRFSDRKGDRPITPTPKRRRKGGGRGAPPAATAAAPGSDSSTCPACKGAHRRHTCNRQTSAARPSQ